MYCAFLLERRRSPESFYVECNRASRLARAMVGTSGSEAGNKLRSVSKISKGGAASSRVFIPATSVSKKDVRKPGPTSKDTEK